MFGINFSDPQLFNNIGSLLAQFGASVPNPFQGIGQAAGKYFAGQNYAKLMNQQAGLPPNATGMTVTAKIDMDPSTPGIQTTPKTETTQLMSQPAKNTNVGQLFAGTTVPVNPLLGPLM